MTKVQRSAPSRKNSTTPPKPPKPPTDAPASGPRKPKGAAAPELYSPAWFQTNRRASRARGRKLRFTDPDAAMFLEERAVEFEGHILLHGEVGRAVERIEAAAKKHRDQGEPRLCCERLAAALRLVEDLAFAGLEQHEHYVDGLDESAGV